MTPSLQCRQVTCPRFIQVTTHRMLYYNHSVTDGNSVLVLILQKMDKNKDGVVTLDEFIESCQEVRMKC